MSSRLPRPLLAGMLAAAVFAGGIGVGARMSTPTSGDRSVGHRSSASTGEEQRPTPVAPATRHNRDDAVVAAAAFTTMFDGTGLLDEDRRRQLLEDGAATVARPRLARDLAEVAGVVADDLGVTASDLRGPEVVWRSVPAGARVEDFAPDRAVVSIWGTGVIVLPAVPLVQPGWRTTTVEMVWERDAWRLAGFRSQPGPEPPPVGGTPSAASQGRLISGFKPLPFPTSGVSGPRR